MKFVGQLLGHHLQRYPLMQLDDVYKLLQQSALGAGHALDDEQALRETFDAEIASMGGGPGARAAENWSGRDRSAHPPTNW